MGSGRVNGRKKLRLRQGDGKLWTTKSTVGVCDNGCVVVRLCSSGRGVVRAGILSGGWLRCLKWMIDRDPRHWRAWWVHVPAMRKNPCAESP